VTKEQRARRSPYGQAHTSACLDANKFKMFGCLDANNFCEGVSAKKVFETKCLDANNFCEEGTL